LGYDPPGQVALADLAVARARLSPCLQPMVSPQCPVDQVLRIPGRQGFPRVFGLSHCQLHGTLSISDILAVALAIAGMTAAGFGIGYFVDLTSGFGSAAGSDVQPQRFVTLTHVYLRRFDVSTFRRFDVSLDHFVLSSFGVRELPQSRFPQS
jgi:hypothetical protein